MVKKMLLVAMVVVAVASLAPAEVAGAARKPRIERTLELEYVCPCGPRVAGLALGTYFYGIGAVTLDATETERYLTLDIADVTGQNVAAKVNIDSIEGNGAYEYSKDVCGGSDEPIEILPGERIDIFLYWGTCRDMEATSTPTRGLVTVTTLSSGR